MPKFKPNDEVVTVNDAIFVGKVVSVGERSDGLILYTCEGERLTLFVSAEENLRLITEDLSPINGKCLTCGKLPEYCLCGDLINRFDNSQ